MAEKLSSLPVGSIVKLKVNGASKNFIIVHQGRPSTAYDISCDGTWLLMEDIYESRVMANVKNDYANSTIHSYLNNTFVNLFDGDIKNQIEQVKLPYTKGAVGEDESFETGSGGLSAKVFLLSYPEVGFKESSYANAEGAVLSYFNGAADSKRVAKLNGSAIDWWLRSPYTYDHNYTWVVREDGSSHYRLVSTSRGIRPALVLSKKLSVDADGYVVKASISGQATIGATGKEISGGYCNVGGVWKEVAEAYVNVNGVWKPAF